MTETGPSLLSLITSLADSANRRAAAKQLAERLGTDDLVVFVRDPDVGALLPALGFSEALPSDWQELVDRCSTRNEPQQAELAYPSEGMIRRAYGLPCGAKCVLVLLDGSPRFEVLEELYMAMPVLAALFESERRADNAATEKARLFEAERLAREKAEAESGMREDLMAMVSHDLKNPLSSIMTATALLKASLDGCDRTQKYLGVISRAATNMNGLIGNLLDLASIDAGSFAVSCSPSEVEPILRESLEMFSPLAADKSLRLECSSNGRGLWIYADRPRVSQILSNLVGNAIKFTPLGGTIRVHVEAGEREAQFSVSDTGPGITEKDLDHIFDRYWRTTRERSSGIGLGLAIAQGLVRAHGGRIWVESRVGKGTTFFFALRRANVSTATHERSPVRQQIASRKRRLLVVDDDQELRESLCEFLEENGYDVIGAKDGIEALEELRKDQKPDLILLDLNMPKMNGWQFREAQKRDTQLAGISLVVMTSSRSVDALPGAPNGVIYKPLRLDQLLSTIERSCNAPSRDA